MFDTLRSNRDALSLRGVPMVGTLANGEVWALSGGILVPTALPAAANIQTLLDSLGSTRGMILRRGATLWETVALGSNGQVLTSNGTDPAWATPSSYSATAPSAPLASAYSVGETIGDTFTDLANSEFTFTNVTGKNMLVIAQYITQWRVAGTGNGIVLKTLVNDSGGYVDYSGETQADDKTAASTQKHTVNLPVAFVVPTGSTGGTAWKCKIQAKAVTVAGATVDILDPGTYFCRSLLYF